MDVQVRNALTHTVIDRYKGPFGVQTLLHGMRQEPGIGEEWGDQRRRQIDKRFVMFFWHQETVPME